VKSGSFVLGIIYFSNPSTDRALKDIPSVIAVSVKKGNHFPSLLAKLLLWFIFRLDLQQTFFEVQRV
jgi:hypothetical protein